MQSINKQRNKEKEREREVPGESEEGKKCDERRKMNKMLIFIFVYKL